MQIFDCGNKMCGRILWLLVPRKPEGQLQRDKKNPDAALRSRPLCGLTILWNLRSTGPASWGDGWFYNPDGGRILISTEKCWGGTAHGIGCAKMRSLK
ncbi:DUF2147 domain-containing protein [Acidiphilium cryptum]|uniref:DUF2147 domain-containing protein n=1 Tax=Acidiphilium cryptum TaxID=524 RepID=UPI0022AC72BA|nr:DUF2147 domain-containing protein [Acidiphilium cryptum]